MEGKPEGTRPPKPGTTPGQLSAFEQSLSLEIRGRASPQKAAAPKAGDRCPNCQSAILDYDGMLNLGCLGCGYTLTGCFT